MKPIIAKETLNKKSFFSYHVVIDLFLPFRLTPMAMLRARKKIAQRNRLVC
jgi:hypothetical protein